MKDFELLKSLYEIHSPSGHEKKMRKFVKRIATQRGGVVVQDNGNLYVTKGEADTYPCICAHLDQVQDDHSKDFTVYKQDDVIFAYSAKSKAQHGLGADDKNGIWIALELLGELDVLKCAFFVGEEVGCVGSSKANMEFFKDVRYCIQPDRKNGHDLITDISGKICSDDFLAAIGYEAYGYKPTYGMLTDVKTLCSKGVGVSCINISCGYYNPHTDEECTSWSELCDALDFAHHICTTLMDVYPHKYVSTWSGYGVYGGYGNYDGYKNYGHGYGGTYGDWYDDWYEKKYGSSTSKTKHDYSYTQYDEDQDYDTMYELLSEFPHLTFEEVWRDYQVQFICMDKDLVHLIYDDTIDVVTEKMWEKMAQQDGYDVKSKQMEFSFADCG